MIEKKLLGLDLGDTWVGVATSVLSSIVIPKKAFKYSSFEELKNRIQTLCIENDIDTIIVGLPTGLRTERTKQTEVTEKTVARLQSEIKIPLVLYDERYTSKLANTLVKGLDISKNDTHSIAAQKILEDYLTHLRVQKEKNN